MIREKTGRSPTKTTQVAEVGDNLARILERILDGNHEETKGRLIEIMGAIDNLRTAVNTLNTTATDGFAAMDSAFAELAADIAAIPASDDVDAEAARVSGLAASLGATAAGFAQRLRDAVPTAPPVEPLPPVTEPVSEPEPEPEPLP